MTVPASVRVSIRPGAGRSDAVAAALFAAGAEALEESAGELLTHVANTDAANALAAAALAADPGAVVATSEARVVDWSTAWRSQIRAHTVGLLTVTPPWLADAFLPERRIVIEPAMAFGTGDHATTRGVLLLMQDVIRPGDTVADLGAGSAVLAIAAATLGAARVIAIESDPDAIGNAEENVAANGAGAIVTVIEGDAVLLLPLVALRAPVRVVFANIVSSVIRQLLPTIEDSLAPNGVAIFSGMLTSEREAMLDEFTTRGWGVRGECSEGEWWSCALERGARVKSEEDVKSGGDVKSEGDVRSEV
ncbi:MAG: 50S ribosomal protein L11 methyltransferase [Gemmatimonadetes bacterium]|nr:50S ribosomal protein L11 methyltransferase [Gemmatimonadota bacterium]